MADVWEVRNEGVRRCASRRARGMSFVRAKIGGGRERCKNDDRVRVLRV